MTRLRDHLDLRTRHRIALARVRTREWTGGMRVLPDFLVIGAQRSGTSSLYRYLSQHPDVVASVRKEVEYFSSYPQRPLRWYRAHFPLQWRSRVHAWRTGRPLQSFEATPDYLFHPDAPHRVRAVLPDVRCVVLLRDPVERAWSHYRHMRRLGLEPMTFAEALAAEHDRIDADLDRSRKDPGHRPVAALRYSYVARGRYAEQLERWFSVVPPERVLVVDSARFFSDPTAVVREVWDFLGLRPWTPDTSVNHSYSRATGSADAREEVMDDDVRAALAAEYVVPEARLAALLAAPLSLPARQSAADA